MAYIFLQNRGTKNFGKKMLGRQGLIQKLKVHINCEKVAQINILANKIVT